MVDSTEDGDIGNVDVNDANDTTESAHSSPSSSASPSDVSSPDSKSSGNGTAPEPPRWRFVNKAKKSLGYSSIHAGTYIKGQSSDELGAKYVAPDISLYKPEEVLSDIRKLEHHLPTNKPHSKEDIEVGKLASSERSRDSSSSQGNEVGKLTIEQVKQNEMDLPSGTFAGLPKSQSPASQSRDPYKEWDTILQIGPKKEREHEWWDGEINDSYKMPGDEDRSKSHREVGKIKFHGPGEGDQSFVGGYTKTSRSYDGDDGVGPNGTDEYGEAREGAIFIRNEGSSSANEKDSNDSTTLLDPIDEENEKKKRRILFLLLLLPLVIGVIIGAVLGIKENENETPVVAEAVGAAVIPPPLIVVANETNETAVPSLQPSLSPSMECPEGTMAFSIEHLDYHNLPTATEGKSYTWKLKDACSGKMISQCEPCPGRVSTAHDGPTRRLKDASVQNSNLCIPFNNEYALEILLTEDTDACCGFDPTTTSITYDNVAIKDMSSGTMLDIGSTIYFGERETPCASESPSTSPSSSPTPKRICSTEQDFNLCLAVDMSGSVCTDGMDYECAECRSSFLPMLFDSECRDSGVSEDTCCNNFANVKEFSSTMVKLLDDFQAEKSFSVVQFATKAQLVKVLSPAEHTVSAIDQLDYTGGRTNHASAIQMCQLTFPSMGSRKNFIMLVTDGESSEPDYDPEGAALAAASSAKYDGTFIIPVFISPDNDWDAFAFMRKLSSDGKVFDVTDFGSLNMLQDRLVDQVSCL
mmetsp:Transcript_35757/g.60966  ORF Transcript_35757/g.60966 Transcript_35757/m.60966 type:complete len:752 (+) Transcript_35757:58-2313(+)